MLYINLNVYIYNLKIYTHAFINNIKTTYLMKKEFRFSRMQVKCVATSSLYNRICAQDLDFVPKDS